MLPISNLVCARVGDVVGQLIALKMGPRYVHGLAVHALGPSGAGVLLLEALEHYPRVPTFYSTNDYCLSLGKPTVQWSGKSAVLSNSFQEIPPVGHLLVEGSTRLISGIVPGLIGGGANPVYWDLATAAVVSHPDISTAIYVSDWNIGALDIEGRFHELASFRLQP